LLLSTVSAAEDGVVLLVIVELTAGSSSSDMESKVTDISFITAMQHELSNQGLFVSLSSIGVYAVLVYDTPSVADGNPDRSSVGSFLNASDDNKTGRGSGGVSIDSDTGSGSGSGSGSGDTPSVGYTRTALLLSAHDQGTRSSSPSSSDMTAVATINTKAMLMLSMFALVVVAIALVVHKRQTTARGGIKGVIQAARVL
jgi:hypothetical protein